MSRSKRFQVAAIIAAAALVFIFTIAVDLSRFFGLYNFYNSYPNDLLKRINVLLAAALVWLSGSSSLNRADNNLMKLVFIIICIGEAFFLMAEPAFAIAAFAVCQCMLTFRHSKGIIPKLINAKPRQKLTLAATACAMAALIIYTFILIYPAQEHRTLAIVAVSYWIILSMSLWAALANYSLELFPKANSKMAAIGMICFYFCDICVGLDTVLPGGITWMLANSLIWTFYTPAITLLALSSYRYEIRRNGIIKLESKQSRALK